MYCFALVSMVCWQGRDKLIGDANRNAAAAAVNGGGGMVSSMGAQVSQLYSQSLPVQIDPVQIDAAITDHPRFSPWAAFGVCLPHWNRSDGCADARSVPGRDEAGPV